MLGKSQSCSLSAFKPLKTNLPIIKSSYTLGMKEKKIDKQIEEDEELDMDCATTTTTSDTDSTYDFTFGSGDDTEHKINGRTAELISGILGNTNNNNNNHNNNNNNNNHNNNNNNSNNNNNNNNNGGSSNSTIFTSDSEPNRKLFNDAILLNQALKPSDRLNPNIYTGALGSYHFNSQLKRNDADLSSISTVCTQTLNEPSDISTCSLFNFKYMDMSLYAKSITFLFFILLLFYIYPLFIVNKKTPVPIKRNYSLLRAATKLLYKSLQEISIAAESKKF